MKLKKLDRKRRNCNIVTKKKIPHKKTRYFLSCLFVKSVFANSVAFVYECRSMAAALAPALVKNPAKDQSSSPDASSRSLQHFLVQESICTSSHTDTDIANLLQEITRLQADGNQLETNTDRDIEDIISEAETLVSETSNKINSAAPVVKKDNYLPYRRLVRQDVSKPKIGNSRKVVKRKKDMSRARDSHDDHVSFCIVFKRIFGRSWEI